MPSISKGVMMSKQVFFTVVLAGLMTGFPVLTSADDFDGSKPLLCASIFSSECSAAEQECVTGAPWMINFPVFMEIDFKAKTVSTTKLHENPRISKISNISTLEDGQLSLQGVDVNFAWSMLVAAETGSMTLSIAGEDTGYLIFGACHPR